MSDVLKDKVLAMTQRLDHSVPDPEMTFAENQAAARELKSITDTLFELLPDKSLSPFERIERLARGIDNRQPRMEELKSAAQKVAELKARLAELVPGEASPHSQILHLEKAIDEKVGQGFNAQPTIQKLERLGDPRGKIEPE